MLEKYENILTALSMGANPTDIYNHLIETDDDFRKFAKKYQNKTLKEIIKENDLFS